ncbi:tripartite tricarboxylate transporter TctB family protein [Szabonella alba]|uniref:Tripartite tricarboxylate transporter TctB family protein n=1 Tax=Szabonella alba TaxID=2804194 RepID=A0A8K0V823_9RHOB|nr:tripartite tricarboxylate transporter TctB family protein [Szabonella alba]MBL4916856.1 tripartite tricarboxylate transporter TctB family protein [Szabonella alba]
MQIGDAVTGLFLALLGLLVAAFITTFPTQAGFFGPGLFPGLIAAGLVLCGSLLLLRGLRAGAGWRIAVDPRFEPGKLLQATRLLLAAVLSFALLMEWVGFAPLSFATLLILALWLRRSLLFSLGMALIVTLLLDLLFRQALRVPLPPGLLEGVF